MKSFGVGRVGDDGDEGAVVGYAEMIGGGSEVKALLSTQCCDSGQQTRQ